MCWCEALCSELCSNRKSNRLRVSSFPQRDSFTVSGSNPAVWNSRVAPPPCRCVTSNQSNQCNHCCWINYKNLYFINVKKTCCYVKIQAIKSKWILDICVFFSCLKRLKRLTGPTRVSDITGIHTVTGSVYKRCWSSFSFTHDK